MRVGIYDRWLATMGGGERHAGAIAELLSPDHRVEWLTHAPVDGAELGRRLGLALGSVAARVIPDDPDYRAVVAASRDYDLFINASHQDYFAPQARVSLLLVYFPARNVRYAQAVGDYNHAKRRLQRVLRRLIGPGGTGTVRHAVFGSNGRSSDQLLVGQLVIAGFQGLGRLRRWGDQQVVLDAYARLLAISEFTQRQVWRYWRRKSQVLYPAVEVARWAPGPKRDWILGVGRFFAGSHNKKQLELVRAFRSRPAGVLPGWELHLAGGYTPTGSNAAYLAAVQRTVAGDPSIHLHLNCAGDELGSLYAGSKLFWHAAGLGEDEERYPERSEHFGITTVEAMAAGCVPLVLPRGGQPEIVRDQVDGVHWANLDTLLAASHALAVAEPRRARLAAAAAERARAFDRAAFAQRLAAVLAAVGCRQISSAG